MKPFKSRKFIIAVVTIIVMGLSHLVGIDGGEETINNLTNIAMTYLGVEGGVDAVSAFRKSKSFGEKDDG